MSTTSFKKNFSLVELLAVIAIMSMLIAIVGVAMKPNPVNSAARELSGAINKARSYALAKRKYTVIHITHPEGDDKFAQIEPIKVYSDLSPVTAATPDTIPGSTTLYLSKGANVETILSGSTLTDFYLCFHPNGGIILDATTDTLTTAGNKKIGTSDGKYFIDIMKRGDADNKVTLYLNKFTGMTSFGE
jgi:type II secretory pathway pseudopilin PulG